MCPHGTVPTVLHIIVGVVRTAVQWFAVMHIATEHIRIEVLYQLERPVLSFSEVVIKVNALLDNPYADSIAVVINNQVVVRDAGQVGIIVTEVSGTCDGKQQ